MKALSPKQRNIIDFVKRFWMDKSYPPTVRDILTGCNISSTSEVDYNHDILEREGYIRRHPGISRGIELISESTTRFPSLKVPVIGQIAAGEPIPVPAPDTWDVTASSETMDVPEDLTKGKTDIYALKVKGQ